ncbi:MAG: 3-hydroxyacyl-CoA dehydrogenase [Proteobacteria bacterium]|nr:3-hydroxyacyl-CoA dehydrogenase [Pseudomonadota bacterium]
MKVEDIKKILILGSGTMGQQIGLLCAVHGYDVTIYDIKKEILDRADERIRRRAGKMVSSGQVSDETAQAGLKRITMTDDPEKAAKDADLVSESVPEDPKLKGKVFAQFNALCKEDTIFTTNTSSLLPSQFAEETGRPEKFLAFHFHDTLMTKIVDVMPHSGTSPETVLLVTAFAETIGQVPIVLKKEHNGFVFNNMLMALLDSALNLASGDVASIQDIDRSFMGVMHSMVGPFGIMDSVGLDTVYKITDYWAQQLNNPAAKKNAAFLKTYIDEGKLGMKSGKGFYAYPGPAYAKPDFLTKK